MATAITEVATLACLGPTNPSLDARSRTSATCWALGLTLSMEYAIALAIADNDVS